MELLLSMVAPRQDVELYVEWHSEQLEQKFYFTDRSVCLVVFVCLCVQVCGGTVRGSGTTQKHNQFYDDMYKMKVRL